jgi:hypothetical protein
MLCQAYCDSVLDPKAAKRTVLHFTLPAALAVNLDFYFFHFFCNFVEINMPLNTYDRVRGTAMRPYTVRTYARQEGKNVL